MDKTILIRTERPAEHQPLALRLTLDPETQMRLVKVVRTVRKLNLPSDPPMRA